jgi:hypothetical protein
MPVHGDRTLARVAKFKLEDSSCVIVQHPTIAVAVRYEEGPVCFHSYIGWLAKVSVIMAWLQFDANRQDLRRPRRPSARSCMLAEMPWST